ncbi:MAG TPA: universal stress protein [Solirubrobacteraceae bacterium]|jgi:nucleotide-binding universal stress UspA family protein|nr:universal stress protein [Solirubrobacteraceae bacterium]
MFRNILVALDGSPDSDQALIDAIDLAESEHARLTLFSAVTGPRPVAYAGVDGAVAATLLREAESESEALLRTAVERVPAQVSVSTVLSHDPVRPALLRQLKDGHHDLLVMGSRGRGMLRSMLLGSVSHFALHHSHVPVMIVHAESSCELESSASEKGENERVTAGMPAQGPEVERRVRAAAAATRRIARSHEGGAPARAANGRAATGAQRLAP